MREKCTPGQRSDTEVVLVVLKWNVSALVPRMWKDRKEEWSRKKNAEAKEDYNDMLLIVLKIVRVVCVGTTTNL